MFNKYPISRLIAFLPLFSFQVYANESNAILFYNDSGTTAVGRLDQQGVFQQTDSIVYEKPWSQIVSVSGHLFFYRDDGSALIAYLDDKGKLQQTDTPSVLDKVVNIVADRYNNLLLYRTDGSSIIGKIDLNGKFIQTDALNLGLNWAKILTDNLGNYIFYRNDGTVSIGAISNTGKFLQDKQGSGFTQDWTHIVANSKQELLFYKNDGFGGIIRTNSTQPLRFQQTEIIRDFPVNISRIVSDSNNNYVFYRTDGFMMIGHIDEAGLFIKTQTMTDFSQDITQIETDTKGRIVFYRNDGVQIVGTVDKLGIYQTLNTSSTSQIWTKIVSYRSDEDCLFDWAEKEYRDGISPANGFSKVYEPYYYRYYAFTDSFAGVSPDYRRVYYMGPQRQIVDLGTTNDWFRRSGCKN